MLGGAIALSGLARTAAVTAIVAVVGGLGTWLIGPANTNHIGASGLVFGFAAYLISRGIFSRKPMHLVAGVAVIAVYGATLLFSLVPHPGDLVAGPPVRRHRRRRRGARARPAAAAVDAPAA